MIIQTIRLSVRDSLKRIHDFLSRVISAIGKSSLTAIDIT